MVWFKSNWVERENALKDFVFVWKFKADALDHTKGIKVLSQEPWRGWCEFKIWIWIWISQSWFTYGGQYHHWYVRLSVISGHCIIYEPCFDPTNHFCTSLVMMKYVSSFLYWFIHVCYTLVKDRWLFSDTTKSSSAKHVHILDRPLFLYQNLLCKSVWIGAPWSKWLHHYVARDLAETFVIRMG